MKQSDIRNLRPRFANYQSFKKLTTTHCLDLSKNVFYCSTEREIISLKFFLSYMDLPDRVRIYCNIDNIIFISLIIRCFF